MVMTLDASREETNHELKTTICEAEKETKYSKVPEVRNVQGKCSKKNQECQCDWNRMVQEVQHRDNHVRSW